MELSIGLSNNNITESPRETHSLQCRRCGNGVGFCGRCQPDRTAKPRPRRPSSAPNSALAAEPPDAAATRLTITRWPEAANDAADERTEAAAAGTAAHGRTAAGAAAHGGTAAGTAAHGGTAAGTAAHGGTAAGTAAHGGTAAGTAAHGRTAAEYAADERTETAAAGTAAHGRTAAGTAAHGGTAAGAAAHGRTAAGTTTHGRTAAGTTTHGRTAAGAAAKNAADERTEAAAAGRSDGTAAAPGWFGTAATDRHATESTGRLISPASVRLRASGDWGNSIPAIASAAINASS
jgi:hypothetical protein